MKAELLATDERLGVHQLTEPTITILDELNGLEDEQGYKCIEVATNDGTVSYTAAPANEGDILTVKVDDVEVTDGNYTVSGIGQHKIEAISSKDGSRPISVTKKIRIVKTPEEATFTFASDENTYFNGFTDPNEFEYIEVEHAGDTVGYTITPTETGTTVSGTVDGNEYSAPIDNETLAEGQAHTLVATIHKQYCNDVTTTRKIMVAKSLEEPVYTFSPNLNGNAVDGFEYIEVSSSTAKAGYTVKPSSADSGAKVSGSVGSTTFAATTQKSGELSVGDYTFTVTVSKDHMISRTFEKKIKVDSKLSAPSITFTPSYNGKSETSAGNNYEYIEVADSSSKVTYTVTNTDSREETSVSTVVTNMANNSTVTGTQLGVGRYRITATVSKDGYTDVSATKYIVIVPKLKEPDITFGKSFNGKGADSDGYLYIEVPYTSSLVAYTASSTESYVTVTTTNRGASINNSGNLSIGTYDIEVTASKDYHDDVSITKKVKVVQEIQEPTCVFTPGLTSESSYAWVEVPSTNHTVSCTITANASGEKIKVTEGGTSLYNTGSSPATFTLSTLGDHTLTIVVTKDNYTAKTFTKTIKIVEELQEPEIKFYKNLSHSTQASYHSSPEDTRFLLYDTYDIDLASDGTGYLYYTATSPDSATVTIKDDGSANTTGKLAIGPHKLVATVSKTNYKTRTFSDSEKKVYVQGILSAPTFTPVGIRTKINSDGSENWQFSYKDYDAMPINVTVGNTGNTLEIHEDGHIVTSASIGHNTAGSVTAVQSREYCKSRTDESTWMDVTIKPITLKYNNRTGKGKLELRLSNFGSSPMPLAGSVVISKPDEDGINAYRKTTGDSVSLDTWVTLNDSTEERNVEITLTNPSDVINVYTDIWRADDTACTMRGHNSTRTLYQVKNGMGESGNASSWTFIVDMYAGYYDRCAQPRIQFAVSD